MTKLIDIITREDFLEELQRASELSYENGKESGFCVWTEDGYEDFNVNRAILGEERRMSTDMTEEAKLEPNLGYSVPMFCYRVVDVHFHPPGTHINPSIGDIGEYKSTLEANINFRESNTEYDGEVWGGDEGTELLGIEVDYLNPIAFIGLAKDSDNTDLLLYQAKDVNFSLDKFCEFVAKYANEKYGAELSSDMIPALKVTPVRFKAPRRVVEYLNMSDQLQAKYIKLKEGKISKKDMEKLQIFEIIQTKTFL